MEVTKELKNALASSMNSGQTKEKEKEKLTVREKLEKRYGENNVWSAEELTKFFRVTGFTTGICSVVRLSDNIKGILSYRYEPRYYFNFQNE